MSKALKTVGMIAGAVALVATGVGAFAGAAFAASTAGATVASIATYAGIAAGVANVAAQLTYKPPPARGSVSRILIDPTAPQPYVMGEGYFAGVLRHDAAYGATLNKVPNPYRFLACVYSGGGPVEDIAPQVDMAAPASWYASHLFTDTRPGACPEAAALTPQWPGAPGWTAASKLSGQAAIGWSLKFDKNGKVFASGVPQLGAHGKWVRVYDPRLDSTRPGGSGAHRIGVESTYQWSANPALHAGTYAFGRFQNGVRTIGCGLPDEAIDWGAIAAWANVCDANGWRMFGVIYEPMPETRWPNLKDIAAAGGARPLLVAGMLTFHVAAPRTALDTFTEADLTAGPGSVTAMKGRRERINTIVPRYRDPAQNWELVPADPVSDAGYVAADGEERKAEWPFNMVRDVGQASQLAAYAIADARELQPIVLTMGERVRAYRPGDCVHLDLPLLGLATDAVILTREFDPASLTTTFTMIGETPAKHAWALTRAGSAPATPALSQTGAERDQLAASAQQPAGWQAAAIRLAAVKNPRTTGDVPRAMLTAQESGGAASISVARHDWDYPDGTADVTRELGTVTGLDPATTYYVYFDDPDLTDGAPAYLAETDLAAAQNSGAHPDRHPLGKIVTPAAGAADTEGGPVPGYGYLALAEDGAAGADGTAGMAQAQLSRPYANVLADRSNSVTSYAAAAGTVQITDGTGADISGDFVLSAGANPQGLTIGFTGMAYAVTGGFDAGESAAAVAIVATGSGAWAGTVLAAGTFSLGKHYPLLLDSWVNDNEDNALTPSTPTLTVAPTVVQTWPDGTVTIRAEVTLPLSADPANADSVDGIYFIAHWNTTNASYAFDGSDPARERRDVQYLVPGTAAGTQTFVILLEKVSPNYFWQIRAHGMRTVLPSIDASGMKLSAPVTTSPFQASSAQNFTGNVGGIAANTLAAMQVNYSQDNDQNASAPTAATSVVVSTQTLNPDGSANVAVMWSYTNSASLGAANNIDGFIIGLYPGGGNISYNPASHDSAMMWTNVPATGRGTVFFGLTPQLYYTAVVIAYRVVASNINSAGVLKAAAAQNAAAHRPATVPNYTGTVNGEPAANVQAGVVRAMAAINGSNYIDTARVLTGSIASNQIDVRTYASSGSTIILSQQAGGDTTTQTSAFSGGDTVISGTKIEVQGYVPMRLRITNPVNGATYSATIECALRNVTAGADMFGSPVWTLYETWQNASASGTFDLSQVLVPVRWLYTGLTAGHTFRAGYKISVPAANGAQSIGTKYLLLREPRAST